MISYSLAWEIDVTSVRLRMKFLFILAMPDHARVKSESIGPIPTEIDLTGGHGVKNLISYSLTWENDVTVCQLPMKVFIQNGESRRCPR